MSEGPPDIDCGAAPGCDGIATSRLPSAADSGLIRSVDDIIVEDVSSDADSECSGPEHQCDIMQLEDLDDSALLNDDYFAASGFANPFANNLGFADVEDSGCLPTYHDLDNNDSTVDDFQVCSICDGADEEILNHFATLNDPAARALCKMDC